MQSCQYCGDEYEGKYNFCPNCERQVKCVDCGEQTVPEKELCLVCGRQLVDRQAQRSQKNKFILEEWQDEKSASRRIEGLFSDEAIEQAASLLGGVIQRSKPATSRLFEEGNSHRQEEALVSPGKHREIEDSDESSVSEYHEQPQTHDTSIPNSEDIVSHSKAENYFKVRGENQLVTRHPDLKGKSIKDQQKRFILLYVWAYSEIFGYPVPSKDQLFEDAKYSSIHDSNFSKRFKEVDNGSLIDTDKGIELNVGGSESIKGILNELDDSSLGKGFAYWESNRPSGAKKATWNKEDKQRVEEWAEISVDVGKFDVRSLDTPAQHAMFALWIITKHLRVADAVKPKLAYSYLTKKYTTVSVDQRPFTDALSRSSNSGKFKKNAEGLYYLTKEAEQEVESWLEEQTVN